MVRERLGTPSLMPIKLLSRVQALSLLFAGFFEPPSWFCLFKLFTSPLSRRWCLAVRILWRKRVFRFSSVGFEGRAALAARKATKLSSACSSKNYDQAMELYNNNRQRMTLLEVSRCCAKRLLWWWCFLHLYFAFSSVSDSFRRLFSILFCTLCLHNKAPFFLN